MMSSIGIRDPPQNLYGGGSAFTMKQAPDNYSFPPPFSFSTASKVDTYTDNSQRHQAGVLNNNGYGEAGVTGTLAQQQQHGLYSNSNRNLITQKFAPVGIPPCNSSPSGSYHHSTTSNSNNRDISPGLGLGPAAANNGNGNANSNNRQSFGANNNITTGNGSGGVFTNSPLSLGTAPPESSAYPHSSSSQPIYGGSNEGRMPQPQRQHYDYDYDYKSSPVTNGTYQTGNKNSDYDLAIPYQQHQRQLQPSPNPSSSGGGGGGRLAARESTHNDTTSPFDSWSKSRIYDTGSTLENLQASARESVLGSVSNKWGLTRDEMKDQLASALASDDKIRILPGFEARTPTQTQTRVDRAEAGSGAAPYSINYGRHEDKANNRTTANASQEKRPASPVTRAQNAIGQTRRELGQVQSMMEMNGSESGGSSSNGFGGLGRQARARQCFSHDSESLAMKRTKQQSYRAELERQIEQSRARKNEMRRLDEEGDHPLGVKYNSPVPHNYLDDCLRSPRNKQAPSQNATASIVRDYTKYLDLMKSKPTNNRTKVQPPPVQRRSQNQHPGSVQSARCAPVNLNPFSNTGPPSPRAQSSFQSQQHPVQMSPRTNPQQQQQEQMAAYQAQAQQYYQAYYQQHPYFNGYGGPQSQPAAFPQYPAPMTAAAPQQPVQQVNMSPRPEEHEYPQLSRAQGINHQPPLSLNDFNDSYNSDIENSLAQNSHKLRENDKNSESDNVDGELEQAMRLHVWQESDQMPDQDLRANLYKRDLMKQIVEKRREQMERKRKEEQEDVKLEEKISEYQEQMRRELEQEKSQLNRLLEIKNRKHAASQRNQNHHHGHLGYSPSIERRVASGSNGVAKSTYKCKTARENGGGDFRSSAGYDDHSIEIGANAKSQESAFSSIALPALTRTLSARCVAAGTGGGGDYHNAGIPRPREIVQDLKVLSNLNKILEKEAERVDHALQEKRVSGVRPQTPRRVAA